MTIHAIADLHLDPGGKPMHVFGEQWDHHAERIFCSWRELVRNEDLVLVPGDISWAMQLGDAKEHLQKIAELPGQKLILRGNHDYWWSSIGRVRDALPSGMFALQNDSFAFGDAIIAGTRGWLLPNESGTTAEDQKVYQRELIRLELSLKQARAKAKDALLVVMMHFPPITWEQSVTGFVELLKAYEVKHVVYGHLHGASLKNAVRGEVDGIVYHQVSADGVDFKPRKILEV